jgi:hypothetical protein
MSSSSPVAATPAGPEPTRRFAIGALVAGAVSSAALMITALSIPGTIEGGGDEVRLASKVMYLLLVCGVFGIVHAIRAIHGRRSSARSLGLMHVILGVGLVFLGWFLGSTHEARLETPLLTMKVLGGAMLVTGVLAFCAMRQVGRYGAWRAGTPT